MKKRPNKHQRTEAKTQRVKELKSIVIMPYFGTKAYKKRGELGLPFVVERNTTPLGTFEETEKEFLSRYRKEADDFSLEFASSQVWEKRNYRTKEVYHGY